MKHLKRIMAIGLAAFMAAGGTGAAHAATPEFAKTGEQWERLRDNVLEYDEIADLVHEYNTTVAANRIANERTRRKTVSDVTDDFRNAADSAGDAIFYAEGDLAVAQARLAQRQAEMAAADNVNDGEIDRLGYVKAEAAIVKQAQQDMNNYHQLLVKKQLEEDNKVYQERLLNSASVKLGVGTATAVDILGAQQSVYNSQAALIDLDAQIEDTRQRLALATGWKQDGRPDIQGLPAVDLGWIDSVDVAADKETALQNDYALQIEKRRQGHSDYADTRAYYETNVAKLEESIRSAVELGYQNVKQSRAAYEQAQLSLTVANNNLDTGQRKLQAGMISQVECDDLVYKQQTAQAQSRLKEMELQQVIENYRWLLSGLAGS